MAKKSQLLYPIVFGLTAIVSILVMVSTMFNASASLPVQGFLVLLSLLFSILGIRSGNGFAKILSIFTLTVTGLIILYLIFSGIMLLSIARNFSG